MEGGNKHVRNLLLSLLVVFLFVGCENSIQPKGIAASKNGANPIIISVKTDAGIIMHYSNKINIYYNDSYWVVNIIDEAVEVPLDNSIIENIGITQ